MIKHFQSYFWIKGKPYGKNEVDASNSPFSYKIIPDPYNRRFSIEKYEMGHFKSIIYDSILLDFRHLNAIDQTWQKVLLDKINLSETCLLVNQDDRAVLIETYHFENNLCRYCLIQSSHRIPIAINRMYYKELGDPFDGIILYDLENYPVLIKRYAFDSLSGEFTELLEVIFDMNQASDNQIFKNYLKK